MSHSTTFQSDANLHFNLSEMDKSCIQYFQNLIGNRTNSSSKSRASLISDAMLKLKKILTKISILKRKESNLITNVTILTTSQWEETVEEVENIKTEVNSLMKDFTPMYLQELKKNISKRSSKRIRLKKQKLRNAEEKAKRLSQRADISKKIDEHLNKIKSDILLKKQKEEQTKRSDFILRDVIRQKSEAKSLIALLESLIKLRVARLNTAKGRGEKISEGETENFMSKIGMLKNAWQRKLEIYEHDEKQLRFKLENISDSGVQTEDGMGPIFEQWLDAMFGGEMPQRDFNGNLHQFIRIRCEWDQYLCNEGTSLPSGWLLPQSK